MTGTGTQNDPYVVSTWPDFVTAVGAAGAYVQVAENTVWDMNEIAPEAAPSVSIVARYINGNGAIIRNPRVSSSFINVSSSGNDVMIDNLTVENFIATENVLRKTSGARNISLRNTVFVGTQSNSETIRNSAGTGGLVFFANEIGGCGFAVNCRGGDFMGGGDGYYSFTDTIFRLSGGYVGHSTTVTAELINCYIEGESNGVYMGNSSINSIINCASPEVYIGAAGRNVLANSDKCQNISENCIAVTDEQLRDEAYLNSIGFPIGGAT
jgi:hypothetical protein